METILNRNEVINPNGEAEIIGINQLNGEEIRLTNINTIEGRQRYRKRTQSPYLQDIFVLVANGNVIRVDAEGIEHEAFQLILENERNGNWIILTVEELEANFIEIIEDNQA